MYSSFSNWEIIAGKYNGKMEVNAKFHWFEGIKCLEIINVDSVFKRCGLKGRGEMKWAPPGHVFENKMFGYQYVFRWKAVRIVIYYKKGDTENIG